MATEAQHMAAIEAGEHYVEWCEDEGLDPYDAASRDAYDDAADAAQEAYAEALAEAAVALAEDMFFDEPW